MIVKRSRLKCFMIETKLFKILYPASAEKILFPNFEENKFIYFFQFRYFFFTGQEAEQILR